VEREDDRGDPTIQGLRASQLVASNASYEAQDTPTGTSAAKRTRPAIAALASCPAQLGASALPERIAGSGETAMEHLLLEPGAQGRTR
jgi:hypothetical protein